MTQNKQLGILLLLVCGIGGLLLWFLFGNKSTLTVRLPRPGFSFEVKTYRTFFCDDASCSVHVPFGTQRVCVTQKQYLPLCETISLPWQKEYVWQPTLTKIPEVIPLSEKTNLAALLRNSHFVWDEEHTSLFLLSDEGEKQLVAVFADIHSPTVVPFYENAFLISGSEIFFVRSKTKQKYRIYEGVSPEIRVLSPEHALMRDDHQLFHFSPEKERFVPLFFDAELPHIAFCNDSYVYAKQQNGSTYFFRQSADGAREEKLLRYHGPKQFTLLCGEHSRELRLLFSDTNDYVVRW